MDTKEEGLKPYLHSKIKNYSYLRGLELNGIVEKMDWI
jgi:hypothetical protein